jgi:enamine deaminase RidA (YjgF/YER057c/UK114 family)
MQTRHINAEDAAKPAGAYSQAVEVTGATRTLFVSGQVGVDLQGNIPPDAAEQNRLAWTNLVAQLRAAGMTVDNIVKITTILPDPANLSAVRSVRAEFLGDRRTASTLIVAGLANPAWKVEIEAIAVS